MLEKFIYFNWKTQFTKSNKIQWKKSLCLCALRGKQKFCVFFKGFAPFLPIFKPCK
jgi:hypothetical protein